MSSSDSYHLKISQRAMAADFEVLLRHNAGAAAVEAAVAALDQLERIEQSLTVYNPRSELSLLNQRAWREAVELSPLLCAVLRSADQVWRETEGAFDVTAGPLVETWGFTQRSGKRPTDAEIALALQRVGWQHVDFNPQAMTVRFNRPDMQINLGAIGKGYALDFIADRLRDAGVEDFLVHGGSSSLVARGHAQSSLPDDPEPLAGWRIGIRHPLREKQRLGGIDLIDQALATSGSGKQFFHHQGRRLGHVIDPRTGWPVDDMLALTVLTERATIADALATGLFVLGREACQAYAEAQSEVGMVMLVAGQRANEVEVQRWRA